MANHSVPRCAGGGELYSAKPLQTRADSGRNLMREGLPVKACCLLASRLDHAPRREISEKIGIPKRTLSRRPPAQHSRRRLPNGPGRAPGPGLLDGSGNAGRRDKAAAWLKTPIEPCAGAVRWTSWDTDPGVREVEMCWAASPTRFYS